MRRSPFIKERKTIFTEIHISDLHFGCAIEPQVEYQILVEQFLAPIQTVPFDIMSINGDFFDHKVMANSDVAMYACMFAKNCVDMCREKGATLLIIMGTESHDAGQLKLFYHYMNDPTVDVRIIESTKFEIIKGKKVLCLPEEYNKGADYYGQLLYNSGWYDSVYMHGTIKGSVFGANKINLDGDRAVFDLENFCYCRGPIISGHVHTPMCLRSHMYYTGSPLRYKFGEEEAKGFTVLIHNIDTAQYYYHFQEIESFRYDTINLDSMCNMDPKEVVSYVKQLQSQGIHNIRLEFTVDSVVVDVLKNFYRTNPTVKIKDDRENRLSGGSSNKVITDTAGDEEKFSFLLDPDINEYDKLTRYINMNKGFTYITTEELIEILEGE